MKKKDVIEAFKEFLTSEEGETIIGNIILKSFNQAMTRTVKVESGRDNPGGPSVIKEETWNMVDWLIRYLPYVEGSIRGCQVDSASARNRSEEVKGALIQFVSTLRNIPSINNVIEMKKADKLQLKE